ncbi:hypothetical protein GCM10022253_27800 [Sphingomonas endophytica]|uniref:Uncharacterized protein n=1 Tax=Sphingomonas endophytica TaxID=869719 RepID=A0A7X0ML35_9SPHN|nr:hypothetical protein [Sphingomonas endophytica]MBB5727082.1 hypothetical protein [Sphingomonas endophytica]MBB6503222.1 hypothetical protein [Sphingomonas endophytica]
MAGLPDRLGAVARQLLVSVDQFAQVVIVGVLFVAGLTDTCPSADETISSYIGRGVLRGAWWARILAPVVDRVFILLGDAPDHCRRNVEPAFLDRIPDQPRGEPT